MKVTVADGIRAVANMEHYVGRMGFYLPYEASLLFYVEETPADETAPWHVMASCHGLVWCCDGG